MNDNNNFPNNNNKLPEGWGNSNNGDAKASPWENNPQTTAWENSPQTSPWGNTNNNSESSSSKPKDVNTENVSAAFNKFAGMAKRAGEKAASTAKKAADYAKSDEAAEKMNAVKNKAQSLASGAGSKLSDIKNKASDKSSQHKTKVKSSDENIPAADEYDSEDNYDVSSGETVYQNDEEYAYEAPDPIYDDVTDKNELPYTEIDNTAQYQETPSAPHQNNNTSFPDNAQNQNYQQPQNPIPPQSVTPGYVIQKQKTSPVLIIVIVVLVLVVGVLGGMFFMMSRDKKSDNPDKSSTVSEVDEVTTESTEAPTESETKTTTAEITTTTETTTTTATTTEQPEKNPKTLTTYPESDISKYPQYIKAAENDRDSGLADYFALVDINADNIPELFLTDMDGRIYAIYTVVSNDYMELHHVGGTGRDWITLYNDGCISHGSSLGNDGGYTDYEYTGGITEIKSYSLEEYNDIPASHGGQASISVSAIANYVTQESGISNKYTTYDTSAATADFNFNANQFGYGGIVVTENDPLNLRVAPSSNSEVIIEMPKGSDVGIFGYNNDWYYVCYTQSGITYYGYASRNFIADSGI